MPKPAPMSLIDSLESVEVVNNDQGPDGFQISFSVSRGGDLIDSLDYSLLNNPLLRPFNRVRIMITLGLVSRVLIDGIITHQQLTPSQEPGKSVMIVTGEDLSVMMDLEEKIHVNPNMREDAIISKIISSYAQYGLNPNLTPPICLEVPTIVERIPFHRGTDLAYIKELAEKNGYVFYVEPTDVPGTCDAYWGPPYTTFSNPQTQSLLVNMGPNTNVDSINFQYNALQPQLMSGKLRDRLSDKQIFVQTSGTNLPSLSSTPVWSANMPYTRKGLLDGSGMTGPEANAAAQAQTDSSIDAVSATGELDSLSYGDILRAHRLVNLVGVGSSYDGIYYVNSVTHRIKIGEYKQSFNLSREGLGSISSGVPI
ncbi:MAG: hypothetical protein WCF23_06555 [Candidatus Nitrosopolaris sp.]